LKTILKNKNKNRFAKRALSFLFLNVLKGKLFLNVLKVVSQLISLTTDGST